MQSLRRLRRVLCPGLLVLHVTGCYSWVAVPGVEPKAYIETERPKYVRIQTADSYAQGKLQIKNPAVHAGSVSGRLLTVRDNWIWHAGSVPLEVILPPLEVRRFSSSKTSWAIAITFAAIMAPLVVIAATYDPCCF